MSRTYAEGAAGQIAVTDGSWRLKVSGIGHRQTRASRRRCGAGPGCTSRSGPRRTARPRPRREARQGANRRPPRVRDGEGAREDVVIALLLLACREPLPPPTYPTIAAGLMKHVDLDGDGKVSAAGYERGGDARRADGGLGPRRGRRALAYGARRPVPEGGPDAAHAGALAEHEDGAQRRRPRPPADVSTRCTSRGSASCSAAFRDGCRFRSRVVQVVPELARLGRDRRLERRHAGVPMGVGRQARPVARVVRVRGSRSCFRNALRSFHSSSL